MATAREYLQSIISQCGDLQNESDDRLEVIHDDLQAIDDRFPSPEDITEMQLDGAGGEL